MAQFFSPTLPSIIRGVFLEAFYFHDNVFFRYGFQSVKRSPDGVGQTMISVTFDDMIRRHGVAQAINLLLTIEHLAQIESQPQTGEEGARFQRALDLLTSSSSGTGSHS